MHRNPNLRGQDNQNFIKDNTASTITRMPTNSTIKSTGQNKQPVEIMDINELGVHFQMVGSDDYPIYK